MNRLTDRVAGLELPEIEVIALGQADPRIFDPAAIATAGAQERLRRWVTAGRCDANLDDLVIAGDNEIRDALREVLANVPTPVRWFAVTCCAFVGVGVSTLGYHTIAPTMPTGAERAHLIVLATSDRGVVAHELGHAWSSGIATKAPRPRAVRDRSEQTLAKLATDWGMAERLVKAREHDELLADSLAALWGFPREDEPGYVRTDCIRAEVARAAKEAS